MATAALRGNVVELSGCHKDQASSPSLPAALIQTILSPLMMQQILLVLRRSREDSWVDSVWFLLGCSCSQSLKVPNSSLWFWDRAFREAVLGWAAQLLPHSTGWFVFLPFLFFEYRCCCLYFRCWYIIDQSIEHAQITLELRFYGREKLTVVRGWLVSILISRHLGCFHQHRLKMLPVPIYLRNNLCLKLIISQLLNFFFFNVSPGSCFFTLRLISDYQISVLSNMLNNSIFLLCCLFQ